MTTQNPNVGDPNSDGAGGNQSPVSQNQGQPIAGAPQGSQEFLELKKQLDLTMKELKGLQSRQDKEKNEQQRFLDELRTQMAKGLTLDEAEKAVSENRKALEKDDLLYRIAEKVGVLPSSPQPPAAGNGGTVANVAAKAVIEELKLDANAPDVVSILAKGLDPDKQELELRRYAMRPRPQPTAADSTSLNTGRAPSPDKAAEIEKGYLAEVAQIPRGNTHQVSLVKSKWRKIAREAGLNLNV